MDLRATKALLPEGFKIEETSQWDGPGGYRQVRFFELQRYRQVRTKKFLRAATYQWKWVLIARIDITWDYYREKDKQRHLDQLVERAWFITELEAEQQAIQEKK